MPSDMAHINARNVYTAASLATSFATPHHTTTHTIIPTRHELPIRLLNPREITGLA